MKKKKKKKTKTKQIESYITAHPLITHATRYTPTTNPTPPPKKKIILIHTCHTQTYTPKPHTPYFRAPYTPLPPDTPNRERHKYNIHIQNLTSQHTPLIHLTT